MGSVCFKFHGKDLTKTVRERMLENGYNAARYFLEQAFPEMSVEIMEQILKGEKTLDGVNDMILIKQDQDDPEFKEWQARLEFQYRGVVMWRDRCWRPYATVGAMGEDDLPTDATPQHRLLGPPGRMPVAGARSNWGAYRALYYAKDPQTDILVYWQGTTYLFEEIPPLAYPPPWMYAKYRRLDVADAVRASRYPDEYTSPMLDDRDTVVFQAVLMGLTGSAIVFEERGYSGEQSRYRRPTAEQIDAEATRRLARQAGKPEDDDDDEPDDYVIQTTSNAFADMVSAVCDSPDQAAGMLAYLTGKEVPCEPGEVTQSRHGVIVPDGTYYPCLYHAHDELIRKLIEKRGERHKQGDLSEADYAYRQKWIKVHGKDNPGEITFHGRVTDATEATIQEYWKFWARDFDGEPEIIRSVGGD